MKIVIVDTETGGVDPQTHALLQLSAIACERESNGTFREIESFNEFISPVKSLKLTEEALTINRLSISRIYDEGRPESNVITEFTSFCHHHRNDNGNFPVFSGWNVNFDVQFTQAAYRRQDFPWPFYHIVLDVAERWRWENIVSFGSHSFGGIAQAAKQLTGRANISHNALEDVRVTLEILNWFAAHS